jgi:hypothetical protein
MTTAELIERVRANFRFDLDGIINERSSDADIVGYLNDALFEYGKICPAHLYGVGFSVSAGDVQIKAAARLGARTVGIEDIYCNGAKLEPIAYLTLKQTYPNFASATAGEPQRWALNSGRSFIFCVPLSAAAAAKAWTADILVAPAALSASAPDVVPDLPEDLHRYIADKATQIAAAVYSMTNEQAAIVANLGAAADKAFSAEGGDAKFQALIAARDNGIKPNRMVLS